MRGYICCPLSGDIEGNIKKAIAYAKFVYDRCEMLPIVPHLMALVLDDNDPAQRALGISLGITQLLTATDIWIFGEQRSSGMKDEIKLAEGCGIKKHSFTEEECEEILKVYG